MDQRIDFKAFKEASEIQNLLEARLPIGIATAIDVFSFLGEERLEHSGFVDNRRFIGTGAEKPFENTIFSAAPVKRNFLSFEANWHIEFHFNQQKLAKIEVDKKVTGF